MRILLVEDDIYLSQTLKSALSELAHTVDHVDNGVTALNTLKTEDYDAVVLDLGLPKMEGSTVLKKVRAMGKTVPILILTAHSEVPSRVMALNSGADDYLTKPFNIDELLARLGAISRRSASQQQALVTIGNFSFNSSSRRVFINDEEIHIPKREFSLLECLLHRQGKVVSKEVIMDSIYSLDEAVDMSVVDVYIHRLRKRLNDAIYLKISTLRGLGYLLEMTHDNTNTRKISSN